MCDIDAELDRIEAERVPVRSNKAHNFGASAHSYGRDRELDNPRAQIQQGASYSGVPMDLREFQIESGVKKCSRCGQTKPLEDFYRCNKSRDMLQGRLPDCIECNKAYQREYRKRHRGESQ